jgi:putative transposase
LIAPLDDQLSITHQCELLGVARSSLYYSPVPVDRLTLALMKAIDREYTAHPFFGARRILLEMRDLGFLVNHKRISDLPLLYRTRS